MKKAYGMVYIQYTEMIGLELKEENIRESFHDVRRVEEVNNNGEENVINCWN